MYLFGPTFFENIGYVGCRLLGKLLKGHHGDLAGIRYNQKANRRFRPARPRREESHE